MARSLKILAFILIGALLSIGVLHSCKKKQELIEVVTEPNQNEDSSLPGLPISEGEIIQHQYYALAYSETNEQAAWVAYHMHDSMLFGDVDRTDDFREDPFVSSRSAQLSDYKGSGYDRGHLCPAGDMTFSEIAMSESFFMSNMSPQTASFNRGIWKRLESQVRDYVALEKELYVVTGPVFRNNIGSIGENKVTVPGHYYKVLYAPKSKKMTAYLLTHKGSSDELESFVVSVDFVEAETNIDFFAGLEDDLENRLEGSKTTW